MILLCKLLFITGGRGGLPPPPKTECSYVIGGRGGYRVQIFAVIWGSGGVRGPFQEFHPSCAVLLISKKKPPLLLREEQEEEQRAVLRNLNEEEEWN